jgi:hypothetical protein
MFRKLTVAMASAALIAASPAIAQSASVAAPAAEKVDGGSALAEQRGLQFYVLVLAVVALAAWGAWQLIDNGDPASP